MSDADPAVSSDPPAANACSGATHGRLASVAAPAAVVAVALAVRLIGVDFGLPALLDPDEGFFMLTAMKLLSQQTLNPGWFGHPGQTTLYSLALIDLAVVGYELLSGHFASVSDFARGLYLDPTPLMLPSRLLIVACGVGCVALTYLIGRDLFDWSTGIVAAALVALNPLHVSLSQIVRTDVQSGLFLLLCVRACVGIARRGRLRDYLLAALWLGLACATKWPAAAVAVALPGACWAYLRQHPGEWRVQSRRLLAGLAAAPLALVAAGPYLLLDFATVRYNLSGEAKFAHLGSTGAGFFENVGWYVSHPLLASLGAVGLVLAAIGLVPIVTRHPAAAGTAGVTAAAFIAGISLSPQLWSRWVVPVLPLFALFAAAGFTAVTGWLRVRGAAVRAMLAAGLILPIAVATAAQARERLNDTRMIASAWARAHLPPGSTLLVEHLAVDLLREPWTIKFPAASLGCVDVRALLGAGIGRDQVEVWRQGKAIVDIGTIDPRRLDSCRADYALFTDYDRYRAERAAFPAETALYERLAAGGATLLTVRPRSGKIGGPVVRLIRLGPEFRVDRRAATDASARDRSG